jgi:hypothetical protein
MADDQPGEQAPAAEPPQPSGPAANPTRVNPGDPADPTQSPAAGPADPTRPDAGDHGDRTRPDPGRSADSTRLEPGGPERSTLDAPVRWSGSAAIPPPAPRRSLWPRRQPPASPDQVMSSDVTDWTATPAVDPWAGQDTPWDAMPLVQELPPTRMEEALPPTRLELPASPPTAQPADTAPPPAATPPAATPPALPPIAPPPMAPPPIAAQPPIAAPPAPRRRWGTKRQPQPMQTANRLPVAPRPAPLPVAPPPFPPPQAWRPPPGQKPPRRPPPQRPLPPPPRRRRHWGRRFALFTLFSVVCCCGVPIAYLNWSPARQYPVRAVLPSSVADLNLRDDSASRRAVARLTQDLTKANAKVDQVFAGVYGDGAGKRVTIFGTTGFRLNPGSDVKSELTHLTSDYNLHDVKTYDLGESGAHERCGVGKTSGNPVVVCTWADHGSLATVVTTRRSTTDSATLTAILRSTVLTRP